MRSITEYFKQFNGLIELDAQNPPIATAPECLVLSKIKVADAVLQPRDQSMLFGPRHSEHHVRELTRVIRGGTVLEPVVVMAFGNHWFVIDGHHRLRAYRRAEFKGAVPVRAEHSDQRGKARVLAAIQASVALNSRDKLQMTPQDKANAAWRMVVMSADDPKPMSKKKISELAGVSPRTVATMRKARNLLMSQPHATSEGLLIKYWKYAQRAAQAIEQGREAEEWKPDQDRELRLLAQNLSNAIPRRTQTSLIVQALVTLFPYMEEELWEVLQERRVNGEADDL